MILQQGVVMIDDFILTALFAAIGIAIISGPLGSFVIWRRMAYFGDSLAHSALLGVSLGIAYDIGIHMGILIICSAFSFLLTWLQTQRFFGVDALLGIFAHTALAVGVVMLSVLDAPQIDIHAILFGDILTVTYGDIYRIYAVGLFVIAVLIVFWKRLILSILSEDIAAAEGFSPLYAHFILTALMTIFVAFSVQIVGVLLVTSLLIIPAATSRLVTNTPHKMVYVASLLGIFSVLLGMFGSVWFDLPSGPMIVAIAGVIFLMIILMRFLSQYTRNN